MIDVGNALFLLLRHGTTLRNEKDEFRGQADDEESSLDKKGQQQAKLAGRFLSRLPIHIGIIFSSDLGRAVHTAALVGNILGIKEIHTDKRLRALDVGTFTGKEKDKVDIGSYLSNPSKTFPEGESVNDFRDRQKSFSRVLNDWIKNHPKEKALVVGHLSNVVYWQDIEKALPGYLKDYDSDKEDLIRPGGIVAIVPEEGVIPLLGENKKAKLADKGEE